MAARGTEAKSYVANKLAEVFGADFIGEVDRKFYIWANDGANDRVQIAISMTCPKTFVGTDGVQTKVEDNSTTDWSNMPNSAPEEFTQEEKDRIAQLLKQLNL